MSGRQIEGDSIARHFPFLVSQAQPLHTRAGTERASDLRMNGLDLLETFRRLYPNLPVIMFTGMSDDPLLLQQAMAKGASAFMSKTDPLDKLFNEVQRVMRSWHSHRAPCGMRGQSEAATALWLMSCHDSIESIVLHSTPTGLRHWARASKTQIPATS